VILEIVVSEIDAQGKCSQGDKESPNTA
jgi:hypothetical protein